MFRAAVAAALLATCVQAAYIEVPEQLAFPTEAADKHAVLTAPLLVIDGKGRAALRNTAAPQGSSAYNTSLRSQATSSRRPRLIEDACKR